MGSAAGISEGAIVPDTLCTCGHPRHKHNETGGCHDRDMPKGVVVFCNCFVFVGKIENDWRVVKRIPDFQRARLYLRSVMVAYRFMPRTNRYEKREFARNLFEVYWEENELSPTTVRMAAPVMLQDRDPEDLACVLEALRTAVLS